MGLFCAATFPAVILSSCENDKPEVPIHQEPDEPDEEPDEEPDDKPANDTIQPPAPVTREEPVITAIKIGGNVVRPDTAASAFRLAYGTVADLSNQKVMVYHNGDKVMLKDSTVLKNNAYTVLDVRKPLTLVVWKNGFSKEYTLTVIRKETGLPIVYIDTDGRGVNDRINWVDGISIRIENPDGTVSHQGTLSMRGRGNGTWTETDKKPYVIKLDEKAEILGMSRHKRWILLANYKDYTLLRNDAAFWLSRQTALPYTISGRHVELVFNGEHRGNYYLCEHAKIGRDRINTRKPDLKNPAAGGYLVEIDAFLDYYDGKQKKNDLGFWSDKFELPFSFKDPDESEIDEESEAFGYFRDYINNLESILMDEERVRNHEYRQYLNVSQAIDFALVNELAFNQDAYNTFPKNGPHSTFMYIDSLGMLCFGPVWDFDFHTFMPVCFENSRDMTQEWVILSTAARRNGGKYYFEYLLKDPEFKDSLVAHWNRYKGKWNEFSDYIDMMADSISASEELNRALWFSKTTNSQNGDRGSFRDAIQMMKEGFSKRWKWIDRNIRKL